tara:strand:- start:74 stop:247 length:174 start_codon:yes stop_codon:yes gene_type:complete
MINKAAASIVPVLVILYFVFALVSDYAIGNANAIKAGDIDEYTVRFFELPPQAPGHL